MGTATTHILTQSHRILREHTFQDLSVDSSFFRPFLSLIISILVSTTPSFITFSSQSLLLQSELACLSLSYPAVSLTWCRKAYCTNKVNWCNVHQTVLGVRTKDGAKEGRTQSVLFPLDPGCHSVPGGSGASRYEHNNLGPPIVHVMMHPALVIAVGTGCRMR